jgi:hypothetical protein
MHKPRGSRARDFGEAPHPVNLPWIVCKTYPESLATHSASDAKAFCFEWSITFRSLAVPTQAFDWARQK